MKKTAAELRNKAIMGLINDDLKLWPQQIVNIDLNHIRHQDEKVLLWVVRRNGAKRYMKLGNEACKALGEYIELGRPILIKSHDEAALFLNRFGKRLTTRSIRNIINNFATDQGLNISPVFPVPFQTLAENSFSPDFIETFNWLGQGGDVVYFVQRLSDSIIKAGCSKDFPQRWAALRQEMGELRLLGLVRGSKSLEGAIKARFSSAAVEGREKFHPTKELLQFIEILCNKKGADG